MSKSDQPHSHNNVSGIHSEEDSSEDDHTSSESSLSKLSSERGFSPVQSD